MINFRLLVTVIFTFSCALFTPARTSAQDSSRLRISLITCTPGDQLYSIFGHSAIRIIDSTSLTDYVYNYGTFNFEDEGFYLKFVRGQLDYYISLDMFSNFMYAYRVENRGITEQVLELTQDEKLTLRSYLNENLKEENKYYKYDFFFDNCTTRLRDLLLEFKKPAPVFPPVMPEATRFREAIHLYLDKGQQYWSKLGIDILLGAPTDAIMTPAQQQFLPDNLMYSVDSAGNLKLVKTKINLFQPTIPDNSGFRITPGIFFSFLFALMLMMGLSRNKVALSFLHRLDGLIFFMTGLLGIVLCFMWFGTDHSMTKNNYNLLWAWPTHAIMAFLLNNRSAWVRKYWLASSIILSALLLAWYFLPQSLNPALIPFVLLLIYRSYARYKSLP